MQYNSLMANQYLGLSLFVMLLSFFIILNALSNFEEAKARPVINSVSVAFSSKDTVKDLSPNLESDPLQSYRSGDALDQLDELFKAQISGVETQKNRLGTIMHLRVRLDEFEGGLMAPISESEDVSDFEGPFLPMLVSLLKAENAIPYRMDMMLNIESDASDLQQDNPEALLSYLKKAASYAQTLERAGLPTQLVTAGLKKGERDYIDLYFYRHIPFNPLQGVTP